jgi:hypothetical protein
VGTFGYISDDRHAGVDLPEYLLHKIKTADHEWFPSDESTLNRCTWWYAQIGRRIAVGYILHECNLNDPRQQGPRESRQGLVLHWVNGRRHVPSMPYGAIAAGRETLIVRSWHGALVGGHA